MYSSVEWKLLTTVLLLLFCKLTKKKKKVYYRWLISAIVIGNLNSRVPFSPSANIASKNVILHLYLIVCVMDLTPWILCSSIETNFNHQRLMSIISKVKCSYNTRLWEPMNLFYDRLCLLCYGRIKLLGACILLTNSQVWSLSALYFPRPLYE